MTGRNGLSTVSSSHDLLGKKHYLMKASIPQFLGISDEHIDAHSLERPVHRNIVQPLQRLKAKAKTAGFELCIASGFRDFDRQSAIWAAKASGERPVLSSDEHPLDISALTPKELLFAMLRWSALPGCSRHHWGTEVDVYDASAMDDGYVLQLTIDESKTVFSAFYQWLDALIEQGESEGFYRPYAVDKGGVSPEPWHLSYAPISTNFSNVLNEKELLNQLCQLGPISLMSEIKQNWGDIYRRFIV